MPSSRSRLAPRLCRVGRPRSRAEGDVGLGSGQTTRRISSRGRAYRSRQRAAAVGRWRDHRLGGSPPRLGAVVQRHHPDRSLRRGPHGRRRFCSARRRDQFRHRAGARGSRVARRRRRHRGSAGQRHAQERPPAAARRDHRHAAGHSGFDHHARRQQPRDRARAPVRAGRGQSFALAIGALRQHSALQCAEDAHAVRRGGRRGRGRRHRARRGSVVLHPRSLHRAAAGEDRRRGGDRRDPRARARGRQLGRPKAA